MARQSAESRLLDPYVPVRVRAVLSRPYRRARFSSFGAGSFIHRPEFIYRPSQMAIGERVTIMHRAWLEVREPASRSSRVVLRIGDGVSIRSHCRISAADSVEIEDDVLLSSYVSIFDADFTVGGGHSARSNPKLTSAVRVGRGSWLGERVTVLRGADIGEDCVIGAHSVVRGTIPNGSVAV